MANPGARILLTGATGYVGGRVLAALEARGERVRCLARRPEYLQPRVQSTTEVVRGDVLDRASLESAMAEVEVAYYLVHSMSAEADFQERDRQAAECFAAAAAACGVQRILYLSGLGSGDALSPHLASRQEVGQILRASAVPTIELRAGIIIGSGSVSFELLRSLVDRLPVMVTPRWARVHTQPIAIEDVVAYLLEAATVPLSGSAVVEIGSTDVVSYQSLMLEYARQRGLRRLIIPVPVLTPYLSGLWLGLVTPVYARVGRKLLEGLRNPTVVTQPATDLPFSVRPRDVRSAIARALIQEDDVYARTRWCDALSSGSTSVDDRAETPAGQRFIDSRSHTVAAPPSRAFAPIQRIGGDVGWYHANALWQLRGFLDLLVGGVGVRRGRGHPSELRIGDTVDFWRVEAFEPDRLLRLRAEMKVPGRAWLQFEVEPVGSGSRVQQTAIFEPHGLAGMLYWYALFPLHGIVFRGMLRGIVAAATAPVHPQPDTSAGA